MFALDLLVVIAIAVLSGALYQYGRLRPESRWAVPTAFALAIAFAGELLWTVLGHAKAGRLRLGWGTYLFVPGLLLVLVLIAYRSRSRRPGGGSVVAPPPVYSFPFAIFCSVAALLYVTLLAVLYL